MLSLGMLNMHDMNATVTVLASEVGPTSTASKAVSRTVPSCCTAGCHLAPRATLCDTTFHIRLFTLV